VGNSDAKKEGTAPGMAQGAGTACQCMRRTVSLCHVALSTEPAAHSGVAVWAIFNHLPQA